jgi:uncharacterized membrane protein YdjX (TVP38/TMEM64 family)
VAVTQEQQEPKRSQAALWALLCLLALSVVATGAMLSAGGGTALVLRGREALTFLAERPVLMFSIFAVWSVVCVSLIVPAGTVSVIVGGILFGAFLPAALWTAAQLVTAPLIYRLTLRSFGTDDSGPAAPGAGIRVVERWLGRRSAEIIDLARIDGLFTVVVLRLLPIIPSAPTCMIAAALGIRLRHLMIGTLMAGWVRPLFYASLGVTIGSLTRLEDAGEVLSLAVASQFLLVLAGAVVLWGVRFLVRSRTANAAKCHD